jgi:hypothetical protein
MRPLYLGWSLTVNLQTKSPLYAGFLLSAIQGWQTVYRFLVLLSTTT